LTNSLIGGTRSRVYIVGWALPTDWLKSFSDYKLTILQTTRKKCTLSADLWFKGILSFGGHSPPYDGYLIMTQDHPRIQSITRNLEPMNGYDLCIYTI